MIDDALEGAFKLATLVAEEISKKTGVDKAITYPIAIEVARKHVEAEKRAVTSARAAAVKRVKGKR